MISIGLTTTVLHLPLLNFQRPPPYTYIHSSLAISQYAILQNNSNIGVNIVCRMRQSTLDRETSGAALQKVPVARCTLQQAT